MTTQMISVMLVTSELTRAIINQHRKCFAPISFHQKRVTASDVARLNKNLTEESRLCLSRTVFVGVWTKLEGRTEGGKKNTITRALIHWGAPKRPNTVASTFCDTAHLLRKSSGSNIGAPNLFLAPGVTWPRNAPAKVALYLRLSANLRAAQDYNFMYCKLGEWETKKTEPELSYKSLLSKRSCHCNKFGRKLMPRMNNFAAKPDCGGVNHTKQSKHSEAEPWAFANLHALRKSVSWSNELGFDDARFRLVKGVQTRIRPRPQQVSPISALFKTPINWQKKDSTTTELYTRWQSFRWLLFCVGH